MTYYAAVSVTEFYGPETRHVVISTHDKLDDAKAVADSHDPDYDARVDARRLGHNQACATYGTVMMIVAEYVDEADAQEYLANGCVVTSDEDGTTYALRDID